MRRHAIGAGVSSEIRKKNLLLFKEPGKLNERRRRGDDTGNERNDENNNKWWRMIIIVY